MMTRVLPPASEAASALEAQGAFALRGLISPGRARELLDSTRSVRTRRVLCGIPNVAWDEQEFDGDHPLFAFFTDTGLLAWVSEAAQRRVSSAPIVWTSRYRLGEYINEHCDASGHVQLLLCLRMPPEGCGGELVLGPSGALGKVRLEPGDGLLFAASRLRHATTPLAASETCPFPARVVCVARYFAEG